jgi:hypothetical protein
MTSMTWFTYDDEHRDFEHDPRDFEQKFKGSVPLPLSIEEPPRIDLEVNVEKKKGFIYKIKEKVKDVKRGPGKLF